MPSKHTASQLVAVNLSEMNSSPVTQPTILELFASEEDPLLRYAFGILGRRALAEEIVQDAFLKLHQHIATVHSPRAWLYRCVKNLCLNHIRKFKRESLSDDIQQNRSSSDNREAPDELLHRLEASGVLRLLINKLAERDQQILKLKYYQDRTYSQIAETLDMTVGNVGSRLHHILKDLAESLRRSGVNSR